jgi:hypothetical protein
MQSATIALVSSLLWTVMVSLAVAQPETIKVAGDETVALGDWGKILPDVNVDACPTANDLTRALAQKAYVLQTLFDKIDPNLLHKPAGCILIEAGSDVRLVTALGDYACVSRHGDNECLWVQKLAIKTKSSYDKDQKDTKSLHGQLNQIFDRQHPECKDWRTNKNLPDYCY